MSDIYNRIYGLCQGKGISIGKMCNELGISRGNLTELKMGRIKTLKAENLKKISGYFGVSVDYLLGTETEKEPALEGEHEIENPDIRMIARAGRKMTPEQAENVRKYAQYMFPEAFEE